MNDLRNPCMMVSGNNTIRKQYGMDRHLMETYGMEPGMETDNLRPSERKQNGNRM
jgi:hypothetical protein